MDVERERILEFACRFFVCYGIKSVSMDYLAEKLRVSKRTLYERFSDKQTLVVSAIGRECCNAEHILQRVSARCSTPLERLMVTSIKAHETFAAHCNAFREELVRYPSSVERIDSLSDTVCESLRRDFQTGMADGSLQTDQNYELLSRVCLTHITDNRLDRNDFARVLRTLLRGCCTEQGLFEMERLKSRWSEQQFYFKDFKFGKR